MQSQNPNPNYDFILKDAPIQKTSVLPKNPLVVLAAAIILIMLLVLVYGIMTGSKKSGSVNEFTDTIGQAQEISRISQLEQPNLKDPNISALAATATAAAASEQAQLSKFLTSYGIKLDAKKLATYKNNSTDARLSSATQTNSLDQAYADYLKGALDNYASSLQKSYAATTNGAARNILIDAYDSTQAMLSSPPLKS